MGLALHYESDDTMNADKLRHTIRISEILKVPGSGDLIVKTKEEVISFGNQFTEYVEWVLSTRSSEMRRIASGVTDTILKGPLIEGASWPIFYESQEYAEGKFESRRKVRVTCAITNMKIEEWLNKPTTCLRVACPVQASRTNWTENFCFCKGLGYVSKLMQDPKRAKNLCKNASSH